ncbi:hypothetical protein HY413_04090 [Candidatus Kaiserbacteria bacterium]|nr:hypothetical protein [Candidatus Kaiserbacteria bacterium]
MAAPLRKQKESSSPEPLFKAANDNKKLERDAANDDLEKDTQELEKRFGTIPDTIRKLGTGPRLNIFKGNVKLLDDFRIRFRHELHEYGEKPKIAVLKPERHAEVQFAFKNAEVVGLAETRAEANMMESLGVPTMKFNPETQIMKERVDIMFAFYDEDARATWKFVKNIAPGGLLVCRGKMASELLQNSSDFKAMGTLDKSGGTPDVEKSRREDYWKHRVDSDAKFKAASEKLPSGGDMVTYDEAIEALRSAHRPTGEKSNHVLENYKALLEDAMADAGSAVNSEDGTITYKSAEMEKPKKFKINLPFGDVDDSVIFILKKRKMGID